MPINNVFRLHTAGGKNDGSHWFECQPYGNTEISDIKDPNGANAKKQITSIPSPFARFDLVKTAFAEVVASGTLDGNTIYHRLVSEAWDVAEIFFNYKKFNNLFDIVLWDKKVDLQKLAMSHPNVAKTLEIFINQDASAYNFDQMEQVYLLRYKGPGFRQNQIVGMTSPCTLFCSTANDLTNVSQHVSFGQDKPFDDNYRSLSQREDSFIEYIYTFRAAFPSFASTFKEVYDYLDLVFNKELSHAMKQKVSNLQASAINNYTPLDITTANTVNILGYPFHQQSPHAVSGSDFEIASTIYKGVSPLILPCESGTKYAQWHYVSDMWGNTNKAPYSDNSPLEKRTLPNDATQFPYLTISDFLEDYIIEIPHSANIGGLGFNHKSFFDGNMATNEKDGKIPLLPLKPLFFEFFTSDELVNGIEGTPLITLARTASGYRVVLNIPAKKGRIVLERIYQKSLNIAQNQGATINIDDSIGFAMTPAITFADEQSAVYRFALVSSFPLANVFSFAAYNHGKPVSSPVIRRNDRANKNEVTQILAIEGSNVDVIQIKDSATGACGMVVPRMLKEQVAGGDQFSFAVDFGTTNTHIAYRRNGRPEHSFDTDGVDVALQKLCMYPTEIEYALDADILPSKIDKGAVFSFPMRTALTQSKSIDWNQQVSALAHVNPAFTFEKRRPFEYNDTKTNLKWDTANPERARAYIESLFIMMRNKVLLNGGTLSDTKVSWFYPTSMTQYVRSQFANEWGECYAKYFGSQSENLQCFTESEAPYNAYRAQHGVSDNVVTIDIGGGTTDVVIVSGGQIQAITSFRFAADVLFGTGYTGVQGQTNGMILHFKDTIYQLLDSNGLTGLHGILDDILNENKSEEAASFFFSLRDNIEVKGKHIESRLDFNKILQNDTEFKIVVILFYSAIIYHIATIMKMKALKLPRAISFSGNGSKTVNTITANAAVLTTLTKHIFEHVLGQNKESFTVNSSLGNPKEQTCIGGLQDNVKPEEDVKALLVVMRNATSPWGDVQYADISQDDRKNAVADVNSFLDMMKAIDKKFSFTDNFGIKKDTIGLLDTTCRADLESFLNKGIAEQTAAGGENQEVQETLFFYPIRGMLAILTTEIYNKLHGIQDGTVYATVEQYVYLKKYNKDLMKEVSRSDAQYRLTRESDDAGTFEFCGDIETAIANIDSTFDDICDLSGDRFHGTSIENVQKGVAQLAQEGLWQVTKKANINIK